MIDHDGSGQSVGVAGSDTLSQWSAVAGPMHPRIIDHLLGGKDNLEPDQVFCARLEKDAPRFAQEVRACREIMLRAARRLAEQHGVGQFVVLGGGFPAPPDVHEILEAVGGPPHGTLYLDPDDVVAAHGRALLTTACSVFTQVDPRDAAAVVHAIDHSAPAGQGENVRRHLSADGRGYVTAPLLTRDSPIAILLAPLVLDRLGDHEAGVIAELIEAIPHGYLVVSHLRADADTDTAARTVAAALKVYADAGLRLVARTSAEVGDLLAGTSEVDVGDEITRVGPVAAVADPGAPTPRVRGCFATTIRVW